MTNDSDLTVTLKAALPGLPPALAKVAHHVADRPQDAVAMSSTELASAAGSSASAVTRLCDRLRIGSYAEFKASAAVAVANRSAVQPIGLQEIGADASPEAIVAVVARAHHDAIAMTSERVDAHVLVDAAHAIRSAAMTVVFGVAASTPVAEDLVLKLVSAGIPAVATADSHVASSLVGRHGGAAVVVILSFSGSTRESLGIAGYAVTQGACVIALTSNLESRLARSASHVLQTVAHESPVRSGGTSSRIAQLMVIDALVLILRNGDRHRELEAITRLHHAVAQREQYDDG